MVHHWTVVVRIADDSDDADVRRAIAAEIERMAGALHSAVHGGRELTVFVPERGLAQRLAERLGRLVGVHAAFVKPPTMAP
jgi:hypothetical protein